MSKGEVAQQVTESQKQKKTFKEKLNDDNILGSTKKDATAGLIFATVAVSAISAIAIMNNVRKDVNATINTTTNNIAYNLTDGQGGYNLMSFYGTDHVTYYFGEKVNGDEHEVGCYTVNMNTILKYDMMYKPIALSDVALNTLKDLEYISKHGAHEWQSGLTEKQVVDMYSSNEIN